MSSFHWRRGIAAGAGSLLVLSGLIAAPLPAQATPSATCPKDHSTIQVGGKTVCEKRFTADGTWTRPDGVTSVDVLLVGGGGGGGVGYFVLVGPSTDWPPAGFPSGGGGGGGGHVFAGTVSVSGTTVPVTVGAGGTRGSAGTATSFGDNTSAGGEAGTGRGNEAGAGDSGSVVDGVNATYEAGEVDPESYQTRSPSGGGGGAGAFGDGQGAVELVGGAGGDGATVTYGLFADNTATYGGGGGGGAGAPAKTAGAGGDGGGGAGGDGTGGYAVPGSANTGGGGGGCDGASIASDGGSGIVIVRFEPSAPAVSDDAYQALQGQTLNMTATNGVLANDTLASATVCKIRGSRTEASVATVGRGKKPTWVATQHGSVLIRPDGSFSYRTSPGWSATDTFQYAACSGATQSDWVGVMIAIDRAPKTTGDNYKTAKNRTLTIAAPGVLGNDSDADANAVSVGLVRGANHTWYPVSASTTIATPHGSLIIRSDGSFAFTPRTGWIGDETIQYLATDRVTLSDGTPVLSDPTNLTIRVTR